MKIQLPSKLADTLQHAIKCTVISTFTLALGMVNSAAVADDTEIFFKSRAAPNLLFILDASGSMGEYDGTPFKRLDRLKDALTTVLDGVSDVNVGLMQFTWREDGIQLLEPVDNVSNNLGDLRTAIDGIWDSGGTPTSAALFEAKKYFAGLAPYRGDTPDGTSTYTSPISNECQSNHIVLLTDGIPSNDPTAVADIEATSIGNCIDQPFGWGTCSAEVARHLATVDQSNVINGDNTVTTHTIGFNFTTDWLKEVAREGGGGFYETESAEDLIVAFQRILDSTTTPDNSFVAPAISVNKFSPLAHRSDVYLGLFMPSTKPAWDGNLKRYNFGGSPPKLRDAEDNIAIDADTGSILAGAKSFWSDTADGPDVTMGGAAEQLVRNRNLYTYTGGNSTLNSGSNRLHQSNSAITTAMLGVTTSDERRQLLRWVRGVDLNDDDGDGSTSDLRRHIGDALHSKPVVVTYGGTSTDPDSAVFFGTNEGFIHAIDADDGSELFAFMPMELLPNLNTQFKNTETQKPYGMDGAIEIWTEDLNRDNAIDASAGDHVYLYAGMRRGGRSYYALDITDRANPKHLWQINGNSGDFAELGQSWSAPVLSEIRLGNTVKKVLVFSGGYDERQDDSNTRSADSMGRSLFIVDASTGDLLWHASPGNSADLQLSAMRYSIAADPTVIDLNGDGLIDQIYLADVGGQIFRFDFNSRAGDASELANGGVIASLSGASLINNRKFFYRPDISLVTEKGARFLAVSIGSGNRAHPLDTGVSDRFYMIRQPLAAPADGNYGIEDGPDFRAINEGDLFDTTDNLIQQGNSTERAESTRRLEDSQGWFIRMEQPGEKVLARSITINNQVLFTTYLPQASISCGAAAGSARAYVVNLFDGTPVYADESGEYSKDTRHIAINRPGIASELTPMLDSNGELSVISGLQPIPEIDGGLMLHRVHWSEQPDY